jgi:alpha-1,2-mannosyltransferase
MVLGHLWEAMKVWEWDAGTLYMVAVYVSLYCVFLTVIAYTMLRSMSKKEHGVAFFHPYANTCGGGERVLWCAVKALEPSGVPVTIYTGDVESDQDILDRCLTRFNITLSQKPRFVRLKKRKLLEAESWPRFTMLGQSLGSAIVAIEALWQFVPHIFVDTTGCAFTLPLAKLCGCRTAAYVHYPTISGDMLSKVAERRPTYNNDDEITSSVVRTYVKLVYYHIFAFLYGVAGGWFTDVIMVNSTWTGNHIRSIWKTRKDVQVVYPPCDTTRLQQMDIEAKRQRVVISIAQYRPEKDHQRQIEAFRILRQERDDRKKFQDVRLVIIGSCRNSDDEALADWLETYAKDKGVGSHVSILRNVSWDELVAWLGRAEAGVHTMWNEHFGIGVVEMQAAGAIPIAHRSAGPLMDIVVPSYESDQSDHDNTRATGFLATEPEEYAAAMATVLTLPEATKGRMRAQGRSHASECFSEELFDRRFRACIEPLLR